MRAPILSGGRASQRILICVATILIGSLLVATITAHRMSADVARLSRSLTHEAMPRIQHVASLRDATLEIQLAIADLIHDRAADRDQARSRLDARLAVFKETVRRDVGDGLASLAGELAVALQRFEDAVERTRILVDRDPAAARTAFQTELLPAANRLGDGSMQQIERNARRGRELATQLVKTRGRIIWLAYTLIAICVVVAGTGMVILRNQNRKKLAAVDAYARDQEAKARDQESKAVEMEEFAGRVAHDIRSPLATASLATDMLEDQVASEDAKATIARLQRSLARTEAIIDGLLAFARAGAGPEPGARADVREVIRDIAEGLAPELERKRIALDVEPGPPARVQCSTGVLVSLIGNLVRNAIKYMSEREPRRISIRASARGNAIRVEISDTGPGISAEAIPRLFEPYFRVRSNTQPGLGLGLPTVKKLAEGHGGRVGVSSNVGAGSTFWFELPCAGLAWDGQDNVRTAAVELH